MKKDLLRIIDANLNRSREGLRVCEEISRFLLENSNLTVEFKNLRQRVSKTIRRIPGKLGILLESRNSLSDVGKGFKGLHRRKDYQDIFYANIQRVKESIRVLEEFSNIFNPSLSKDFTKLRFKVYNLEKRTIARF